MYKPRFHLCGESRSAVWRRLKKAYGEDTRALGFLSVGHSLDHVEGSLVLCVHCLQPWSGSSTKTEETALFTGIPLSI